DGINNDGTVFTITPKGELTVLHSFDGTDGFYASDALVQATDGNFYGTTTAGGASGYCVAGCGTLFKMTPKGTLTTLYSFCTAAGCPDGEFPYGGLVQGTDGNFYGTTYDGGASSACGASGCGTVFSLSVGLGPFVKTNPTSGKVGAKVTILGNGLTGATSVTFNGTAATFTAVRNSEITTTVPAGATTGTVEVTAPKGMLKSNLPFRVTP
ncbi:MAG TPA: choice-of-anchor tandem repeat GloVer-containing protein, partial [Terriglobales bacterium]|nr:choice-of-anchor tandem repeat GloVer-containing protein [Terriglobales bacterium]